MATKKKSPEVTTVQSLRGPQHAEVRYQIQDGIPLPERAPRGRSGRFPFDALKEKQAFVVTLADEDLTDMQKLNSRVRSAIYSNGKRLGVKFIAQADPKAGTVTVWRAAQAK
jgi:hypothetical protein